MFLTNYLIIKSGLVDKVKNSTISLKAAEAQILNFLKPFARQGERLVIAGNSVHVDKQFIEKDFPLVNELLHYRVVGNCYIYQLYIININATSRCEHN
jgi:oligoribonuclease